MHSLAQQVRKPEVGHNDTTDMNCETINQISNFVEAVRLGQTAMNSGEVAGSRPQKQVPNPELEAATNRTEQAIIEAEKFRAQVADPPGTSMNQNIQLVSDRGKPSFLQQANVIPNYQTMTPRFL